MATSSALGRIGGSVGRALVRAVGIVALAAVIGVAAGVAAGRWRLMPAPDRASRNGFARSDLIVAVPVSARGVRVGDVVIVRDAGAPAVYTVASIDDSARSNVQFNGDPPSRRRSLHSTVWRVRFGVPFVGLLLALAAGPAQCAVLLVLGIGLIVIGERRRARVSHAPALVR